MLLLVNGATKTMKRILPHKHLGVLLSPGGNSPNWWPKGLGIRWAMDNGAFSGFNRHKWRALLKRLKRDEDCLFVVAPDCVGDAVVTRMMFAQYAPEIRALGFPVAYVLQDGQKWEHVPWEECAAIFVGGTTAYKESQDVVRLIDEAKRRGKWVHMGRLNTLKRLRFAVSAGCDSCDGSSFSWFSDTYIPPFLEQLQWMTSTQQCLKLG